METEHRLGGARGRGSGCGSEWFVGTVSGWQDEEVLELDGGDDCTM